MAVPRAPTPTSGGRRHDNRESLDPRLSWTDFLALSSREANLDSPCCHLGIVLTDWMPIPRKQVHSEAQRGGSTGAASQGRLFDSTHLSGFSSTSIRADSM